MDHLLDRDCVIFDGRCDCPRPVYDTCKLYSKKGSIMNEVLNEGVAVDPILVPTSPTPAPAEVAKEVAVEATEAPAK